MREQSNQFSFDTSGMRELSPDSRVWQRISDSVERRKRQSRMVQALSVAALLVVSACAGFGYFSIIKGTDGGTQFSENLDMRLLSEPGENESVDPLGEESYLDYFSSFTQAYLETAVTSDELEAFLECIAEVNATYPSDEAGPVSQDTDASDTNSPVFNFRYDAHSQCLKHLPIPRLKARFTLPKSRKKPI